MRHRHHRQYGLPNANQILLTMVVCTLLFFALLRRHWLQFGEDPDVHAGLQRLYVHANDSAYSQTWSAFCDDQSYELHIPETSANTTVTVGDYWDGAVLCAEHGGKLVPAVMQILLALSLSCALLSVLLALYLQLGNPTRELIFWLGTLPSVTLMATAVLGTAALALWQQFYRRFDNGDCFSITVAATVIAYGVAISMVVRWRWPGICAVANEQQALGSRPYGDHLPPRRGRRRASTAATTAGASEAPLHSIAVPLNR